MWEKRKEVGLTLLAVTAATGFIDMAPTQYLPTKFPWTHLRFMPTWLDEQYTLMSVATLLGIAYILYEFGFVARTETQAALEPVLQPALETSAARIKDKNPTPRKKPERRKNRR